MSPFTKLHGRLVPPGRELRILRKLPHFVVAGTLLIAAIPVLGRILPPQPGVDSAKHVLTVDIFAIATGISFVTAVFTIAIGCIVVHVMKGPAYIADAYPVEHAERPSDRREDGY